MRHHGAHEPAGEQHLTRRNLITTFALGVYSSRAGRRVRGCRRSTLYVRTRERSIDWPRCVRCCRKPLNAVSQSSHMHQQPRDPSHTSSLPATMACLERAPWTPSFQAIPAKLNGKATTSHQCQHSKSFPLFTSALLPFLPHPQHFGIGYAASPSNIHPTIHCQRPSFSNASSSHVQHAFHHHASLRYGDAVGYAHSRFSSLRANADLDSGFSLAAPYNARASVPE